VSLSLVCRALLPCARRLLYRQPLSGRSTWKRAILLHKRLAARGGALAKLVRNLDALDLWHAALAVLPLNGAHAFQMRGMPDAFAWQTSVLGLCSNLRRIACAMDSMPQATKLLRALGPSMASLSHVKLSTTRWDDSGSSFDGAVACHFLGNLHRAGCALQGLALPGVDPSGIKQARMPQLEHNLEELAINMAKYLGDPTSFSVFLPVQVGILRKLDIDVPLQTTAADLQYLLTRVGGSLTTLRIASIWRKSTAYRYSRYGIGFTGPVLPLEAISLFPFLEHLTLERIGALSIARLQLLAQHCGANLRHLDASCSNWVADDGSSVLHSPGWHKRVFPEHRVAEILGNFARLETVNLGRVPVRATDGLGHLEAAMQQMDVDLRYEQCHARCEGCGSYHADG